MMGWGQEHGPYVIKDGDSKFSKNSFAWNKQATVIYIESPATVGFSLCPVDDECNFDDENSAGDNLIALLNLMIMKFPDL